jgi:hypothetical protein
MRVYGKKYARSAQVPLEFLYNNDKETIHMNLHLNGSN